MSNELPINDYIEFYLENKRTIYMDPSEVGSHGLNHDNIDRWIENIEAARVYRLTCRDRIRNILRRLDDLGPSTIDEDATSIQKRDKYTKELFRLSNHEYCDDTDNTDIYLAFGHAFKHIMRYVPFNEMMSIINNICGEIKALVDSTEYDKIFIYVEGDSSRSNTWISLLYLGELLKNGFFTDIIKNKTVVINNHDDAYNYARKNQDQAILVLHMDDMSYSGTQAEHALDQLPKVCPHNDRFHWYLTMTFIGSSAVKRYQTPLYGDRSRIIWNYLKMFKSTQIVDTFVDQAKEWLEEIYGETRSSALSRGIGDLCSATPSKTLTKGYGYGEAAFFCREQNIPIYFDHKVADSLSTLQKLLYTGAWPTTPDHCYNLPLINGFKVTDPHYDNKACYGKSLTDIEDEYTCPKTFYKRSGFFYKYRTKRIPKKGIVEAIIESKLGDTSETAQLDPKIELEQLNSRIAELDTRISSARSKERFTLSQERDILRRKKAEIIAKQSGGKYYQWSKIVNPETGRKVRTNTKIGKRVINNYLTNLYHR